MQIPMTRPSNPHPAENRPRRSRGWRSGYGLRLAAIIAVKTMQNPENHNTYPIFRDAARAWWNGENVYDS